MVKVNIWGYVIGTSVGLITCIMYGIQGGINILIGLLVLPTCIAGGMALGVAIEGRRRPPTKGPKDV